MSTKTDFPESELIVSDDPRINGKHPTMVPGHPSCNYEKFMAAQRKVTVYCQSDQRNAHFKTLRLSFNGNHSIEVPFDRQWSVPYPYGAMIVQGALGSTTDDQLIRELAGQVSIPQLGPLPGPLSGATAADVPGR